MQPNGAWWMVNLESSASSFLASLIACEVGNSKGQSSTRGCCIWVKRSGLEREILDFYG